MRTDDVIECGNPECRRRLDPSVYTVGRIPDGATPFICFSIYSRFIQCSCGKYTVCIGSDAYGEILRKRYIDNDH